MSDAAERIRECDAQVLAQWRTKGMDYAADVVEAYQAELARLSEDLKFQGETTKALNAAHTRLSEENKKLHLQLVATIDELVTTIGELGEAKAKS